MNRHHPECIFWVVVYFLIFGLWICGSAGLCWFVVPVWWCSCLTVLMVLDEWLWMTRLYFGILIQGERNVNCSWPGPSVRVAVLFLGLSSVVYRLMDKLASFNV